MKQKQSDDFYILNNTSENVTLGKSIYKLGSISNKVTISDVWIFDTKYKKALPLIKDYLGMIYSDPDHE